MIRYKLVLPAILLGLLSSNIALSKDTPERDGFTLELGIGLAFNQVIPEKGDTQNEVGLAPLSLSLGGFLNNQMAIMFRMAGTSYFEDNAEGDMSQITLGFYGIHFQYWISDKFFFSAGPGLALFGYNPMLKSENDPDPESGFGFSARAGFSFANWENHSLRFSLEVFPCFFDHGTVMGEALTFEWQWF